MGLLVASRCTVTACWPRAPLERPASTSPPRHPFAAMVNLCRDEVTHTLKHKVSGSMHSPAHPARRLLLPGRLLQLLAALKR